MSKKRKIISISLIVLVILAFLFRVFLSNLFSLTIEQGYFIPEESNMFTFKATKMNPGSGDWWLYGEDNLNLYALAEDKPGYYVLNKADAPENVSELDKTHWGSAAVFRPMPKKH
ncbi:MAG: hypothetical protein ABJN69_13055 [Hellea sp.]